MKEVWMMWQEIARMMRDEEEYRDMTRDRNYLARKMIAILPNRLDIIAELAGLTLEEVQKEKDRLGAAWEHVLYGRSSEGVSMEVNIKFKEAAALEAVRIERRRCIFRALDRGLMPDAVQDILGIGDKEMDYWMYKWIEMEEKYDW